MYSFDGTVGLWMVGRRPNLGNAQKITQLRYHLPCELRCLVRHQSSRKPEHQEKLVVQNVCLTAHDVIVGDIRLSIACEMVLDDQDILDDQFLLDAHCHLHGHVVDVYQIQWLSTEDGLHRGYLWLLWLSNIWHFS